jgi:hypothetical protein
VGETTGDAAAPLHDGINDDGVAERHGQHDAHARLGIEPHGQAHLGAPRPEVGHLSGGEGGAVRGQDRHLRRHQAPDVLAHLAHGRRARAREHGLAQGQQAGGDERTEDIRVRALPDGLGEGAIVRARDEGDHGRWRRQRAQARERRPSFAAGQGEVDHGQARRLGFPARERGRRIRGALHVVAGPGQGLDHLGAHLVVTRDDEDARGRSRFRHAAGEGEGDGDGDGAAGRMVTFWSTIRFCGLSPSTGVSPM